MRCLGYTNLKDSFVGDDILYQKYIFVKGVFLCDGFRNQFFLLYIYFEGKTCWEYRTLPGIVPTVEILNRDHDHEDRPSFASVASK